MSEPVPGPSVDPSAAERRALSAVSDALVGAATDLSLDAVLEGLVHAARDLVGARYAALGVPDGEGGFARFITSGMDDELIERLGPLPRTHGLLDVMLTQPTPFRTPDIRLDPRFRGWWPHEHPQMRSFLGYPIVFKGDIIGAFYLTDKIGAPVFDEADEHLVGVFVPYAAVLVEYARLYEQSRELSVAGERNRIARELHDSLTQTLFGTRLALKTATLALGGHDGGGTEPAPEARPIERGTGAGTKGPLQSAPEARPIERGMGARTSAGADVETALEQIARATALLNDAFGELRALILDLRPPDLESDRLSGVLRKQLALIQRTSGLTVDLRLDAAVDVDELVEPEAERQLLRILQEAVANAVRHAGAQTLAVSIGLREPDATGTASSARHGPDVDSAGAGGRGGRRGDERSGRRAATDEARPVLRLEVRDDGVGFDPTEPGIRSRRLGLTSMLDRARSLGGHLTIESSPGSGTIVRAEVPVG